MHKKGDDFVRGEFCFVEIGLASTSCGGVPVFIVFLPLPLPVDFNLGLLVFEKGVDAFHAPFHSFERVLDFPGFHFVSVDGTPSNVKAILELGEQGEEVAVISSPRVIVDFGFVYFKNAQKIRKQNRISSKNRSFVLL